MIYGIGTDVVEVKRIKGAIERFGDAIAKKYLITPSIPFTVK